MQVFKNKTFDNLEVQLDGCSYHQCTFNACRLVFSGQSMPDVRECTIRADCLWGLTGPAQNTINFLTGLYKMVPVGTALVEGIFQQIRTGVLPPNASVVPLQPTQETVH